MTAHIRPTTLRIANKGRRVGLFVALTMVLFPAVPAWGAATEQRAKLAAFDGGEQDAFGLSVAIDGDTAVIGAYLDDDKGSNAGAAYVFIRSDGKWVQQAKLLASDGLPGDLLGTAVDISGDTIIVGATGHDGVAVDAGAAYVFVRTGITWTQQAKLTGSAVAAGDHFGAGVALDSNLAVVSAPFHDSVTGNAYAFLRSGTTWTEDKELTASDAAKGDRFGLVAAMDGSTVAIGAPLRDEGGVTAVGAVYVFRRELTSPPNTLPLVFDWKQKVKLTAGDRASNDLLGFSVDIDGTTVVAGAPFDDDKGESSGSVYVFKENAGNVWTQEEKLTASDGEANDDFGAAVAILGDRALVGAPDDDNDKGTNAGAGYLFTRSGSTWTGGTKLTAFDGQEFDSLSSALYGIGGAGTRSSGVALGNPSALLGAPGDDDNGSGSGSVYVLDIDVPADTVGLVDPGQGRWHLRNSAGQVSSFFFGNPGDVPFMGDWDCDGDATPGLFRQSDAFVYLSNANTSQVADIRFFFGDPGDVPISGDFNGDGCDTVSIYRPSVGRFFIINKLGQNEGGLGAADTDYLFGNPGDKPFVGDFDGDGVETVGLHRESTGLVYFRNSHTQGIADAQFIFGDPGDRLVAGDWGILDSVDTPALFRPANTTFFFRYTNTQGNADEQFITGETPWLPVAGTFGLG